MAESGESTKRPLVWGFAALVWSVLVATGLLTPGSDEVSGPAWLIRFAEAGGDKVIHAGLFFVEALLLAGWLRASKRRAVWIGVVVAALFGGVLEWLQIGIPGRGWETLDVVANTAGAVLYGLIASFRRR